MKKSLNLEKFDSNIIKKCLIDNNLEEVIEMLAEIGESSLTLIHNLDTSVIKLEEYGCFSIFRRLHGFYSQLLNEVKEDSYE